MIAVIEFYVYCKAIKTNFPDFQRTNDLKFANRARKVFNNPATMKKKWRERFKWKSLTM